MAGQSSQGGDLMDFEVYCDESFPDLFTSQHPRARHLMIGSLWLPAGLRKEIKEKINTIREQHNTWGEIKWAKISPSRLEFYFDLVDLFQNYGKELRFRCIAIDHTLVDMAWHDNDGELGFYKFYYQLLHHWILDFNQYAIFCDAKTNRDPQRLNVLRHCLSYSNLSSDITNIQSLPSKQVALIQLCDFLLGIAGSRMNRTLTKGSAKEQVVQHLEGRLGLDRIQPTAREEKKFNVFHIRLQGGW